MVATSFTESIHHALVLLKERKAVTANWYTEICLPEVFKKLEEKRIKIGTKGIFFHRDNASAHSTSKTKILLKGKGIKLIVHLPYSPDFASWDFYLFPKLKKSLRCTKFTNMNVALESYLTLEEISLNE